MDVEQVRAETPDLAADQCTEAPLGDQSAQFLAGAREDSTARGLTACTADEMHVGGGSTPRSIQFIVTSAASIPSSARIASV